MNPCCTHETAAVPSPGRPSAVTTSCASSMAVSKRQELKGVPSTSTVHVPHTQMPQYARTLVVPTRSRRVSSPRTSSQHVWPWMVYDHTLHRRAPWLKGPITGEAGAIVSQVWSWAIIRAPRRACHAEVIHLQQPTILQGSGCPPSKAPVVPGYAEMRDVDNPHTSDPYSCAPTWSGTVFSAFFSDVFSRCIVGWKAARTMATSLVLDALNMARGRVEEPTSTA